MKNIRIYLIVLGQYLSLASFAQSILLTPNKVESKQNSAIDNIILQSNNQPNILGKRHNGTLTTPTAVVGDDDLLSLQGVGYNGTAFTGVRAAVRLEATQNWTSTNNGSRIKFLNTPNGSTTLTERMIINQNGNVGIGVSTPGYKLELQQDENSDDGIGINRLGGDAPAIFGIGANGTIAAPTATLNTNILARFGARGHNGTGFTASRGRIDFVASQNWNSTNNGTDMKIYTTNTNSVNSTEKMIVKGNGNVGIGTSDPQAKLVVNGEIVLGVEVNNASNASFNSLNRNGKSIIRLTGSGTLNLRGMDSGVDGMVVYVYNYADSDLTVFNDDPAAPAGSKILTQGYDVHLYGRGAATFIYDGANSVWRLVGKN